MLKKKKKNKTGKFRFQNLSIARRITILYGGFFSLSVIVISVVIFGNAVMINESVMKQEINKALQEVEMAIKSGDPFTQETLDKILENRYVEVAVAKIGTEEFYTRFQGALPPFIERQPFNADKREKYAEGKITVEGSGMTEPPPPSGNTRKNRAPSERSDYTIQEDKGKEFMFVRSMVFYDGEEYFIQAFKMLEGKYMYAGSLALRLILLDAMGILLAVLIGRHVSRLILNPVQNIRKTAERISIEDLSRRIDVPLAEDEMKELTVTFNSMIDRLEASFKKQAQFISDASHELRTPISVIQGYANLLNRWGKSDPVVLQESIDSILAETEHMSTLIKKLLFLAKSDQNRNQIQKQPVSLNALVQEVIRELEIMETDREISFDAAEEFVLTADTDLLKQLIWVYTENAVKYTKAGGHISFILKKEQDGVCLTVEDNGMGIPKEDIANLFDRFYRVDKSRNKDIPGTGLGLSIAKWIVESHSGRVEVRSQEGAGSAFMTWFPLS